MRYLLVALLFLFAAIQASAATFSIPGTGVSFVAPDGFTQLSPKQIALKYPGARPPSFVVGNAARTTTIALDLKPDSLKPEQLQQTKAKGEAAFGRLPGIVWVRKAMVSMQGQQWIYFEMTSRASDTDIHNIMLITSLRGKMLTFNFNSTKAEFPAMEVALRKSVGSISLHSK